MEEIKCLIVEDEKPAQRILENFISKVPGLILVKVCENAIETIHFLHHGKVDLIFLDINMPELSGLEMLNSLEFKPKVIITTAYSEYALDGYEFGVIDYLMKPFSFQRFLKAVNRYIEQYGKQPTSTTNKYSCCDMGKKFISIKTDSGVQNILLSDIYYIESYGNYLKINCSERKFVVRDTLINMEKKLPDNAFIRIHRSNIVSISKIESFKSNHIIIITGNKIPVGNLYKSRLRELFN
ncbi:LytR/AlgR family response regulator transcription factor [Bacteroidota bacterium]